MIALFLTVRFPFSLQPVANTSVSPSNLLGDDMKTCLLTASSEAIV